MAVVRHQNQTQSEGNLTQSSKCPPLFLPRRSCRTFLIRKKTKKTPILFQKTVQIREGTYSSRQVVEVHISRIKEVNPHLNAAVALRFDEALQEADLADTRIKAGQCDQAKTPFLGVPCSIKVNPKVLHPPCVNGVSPRLKPLWAPYGLRMGFVWGSVCELWCGIHEFSSE